MSSDLSGGGPLPPPLDEMLTASAAPGDPLAPPDLGTLSQSGQTAQAAASAPPPDLAKLATSATKSWSGGATAAPPDLSLLVGGDSQSASGDAPPPPNLDSLT